LKRPEELLKHILDECDYLIVTSQGMDIDDLLDDETLKRAMARSIEIIGEASKQIDQDFKEEHKEISWKEMSGMRDILIHSYHSVDYRILWDVVVNDIPRLKEEILSLEL